MKRIFLIILIVSLGFTLKAQTDALSYQAIIIDNNSTEIPGVDLSGSFLSEGEVALRFSIINSQGITEYQEIQYTITDPFGMVNLIIGQGEMTGESFGPFNEISWDGTPKQLEVELAYGNDGVFESLSEQELLFVPYAYHRNITATGTLDVDGATTLNNSLTVTNQSPTVLSGSLNVENGNPTSLSGDLTVDGDAFLNTLDVTNQSTLNGDVAIGGNTTMEGELSVLNESPTDLTGTLQVGGQTNIGAGLNVIEDASIGGNTSIGGNADVAGNLGVEGTSALNGQVTIDATVTGGESSYGAYPLRVEGSEQGIAIKVNGGETETKNFISFMDGSGTIHGRVEGQTLSELQGSFRFIWDVAFAGLDQLGYVLEAAACGAQWDFGETAVNLGNNVSAGVQWVELTAYYELNVGVSFLSGGADYAEWLERENPLEDFYPGEVVGVRAGKISKNTADADHVLAVSTNPIVLGNMPKEGQEANYEKIAFLGQVPIRVLGKVNEGDYILPSGKHDGLAVAYAPSDLPTHRFKEIIGVAWESGSHESINQINTAIGLTANDLSDRVVAVESEVASLKKELEEIKAMLRGETEEGSESVLEAAASEGSDPVQEPKPYNFPQENTVSMSDEEFEKWLGEYGDIIDNHMWAIRDQFVSRGIDYAQYPEIAKLLDTPQQAFREMRSGDFMAGLWETLESRVQPRP
jgi:hypothetical protein